MTDSFNLFIFVLDAFKKVFSGQASIVDDTISAVTVIAVTVAIVGIIFRISKLLRMFHSDKV